MAYGRKYSRKTSVKKTRFTPKALTVKRRRRNYKNTYKLSKPFKQVLNKVLDKDVETHWETVPIKQQNLPPQPRMGASGPVGMQLIMPRVPQVGVPTIGVPSGEFATIASRVGSKIDLKSFSVNLMMRLNPAFTSNSATGVWYQVLLCTCKKVVVYNDFVTAYFAQGGLKDSVYKQAAEPKGYTPDMADISDPINTNLFTVHDRKEGILSKGQIIPSGITENVFAQSAYKQLKLKINVKSKVLKYNQPEETYPNNFQPFILFFWKDLNSQDYTLTNPVPDYLEVSGKAHMSWHDMTG